MAKMRGIKPEIWTDDKFVELSPLARLLFIGLWNFACDNGHLDDKPSQLRMRILPTDDCSVTDLLSEMVEQQMIERGNGVITIPNLPLHQRIDKRYLTTCAHCGHDGDTTGARRDPSVSTSRSLGEGRKEGEGEGIEGEGEGEGDSRKRPKTKIPKSWKPTPDHLERALAADVDLGREEDRFRAHAETNDRRAANWNAAFTQWLIKAAEFAEKDRSSRPRKSASPMPVHLIEDPPPGLNVEEYDAWFRQQVAKRKAAGA